MDRKSKTRFILFCLFTLFIFSIGNGYIDVVSQSTSPYWILCIAWFFGTVIGNLMLVFLFRLVSIRRLDITVKKERELSAYIVLGVTAAFLVYGIIMTHRILFPLCVNAGHLTAFFLIYIWGLRSHEQDAMRKKLLNL